MFIDINAMCISGTPLGVRRALDSVINISLLKECQARCKRVLYKHSTTTWLFHD